MAHAQIDELARFRNQILVTGVLAGLAQLPDGSIDCVMTSPPYWGLRDYGIEPLVWDGNENCEHEWRAPIVNALRETRNAETMKSQGARVTKTLESSSFAIKDFGQFCAKCGAWRGSLGLEPTIDLYLAHLSAIFDEIRRVLKPTGTCWVNLGDCYSGGWGLRRSQLAEMGATVVPPKSLCLMPHRFAIGMVERGWMLRNHIVWYKPNHMPASVRDRLANSWDHVFFFVKSMRYYFDLDAVRVPHRSQSNASRPRVGTRQRSRERDVGPQQANQHHPNGKNPGDFWDVPPETRRLGTILGQSGAVKVPGGAGWTGHPPGGQARIVREKDARWLPANGKNPGDCWHIPSQATPYAHFATYPERLVELPIKAGCPLLTCVRCGAPKRDVRIRPPNPHAFDMQYRDAKAGYTKLPGRKAPPADRVEAYNDREYSSRGGLVIVAPGCGCKRPFAQGIVLDPFMGTGTTAVVARRLERDFIGIEISEKYADMARRRLKTKAA